MTKSLAHYSSLPTTAGHLFYDKALLVLRELGLHDYECHHRLPRQHDAPSILEFRREPESIDKSLKEGLQPACFCSFTTSAEALIQSILQRCNIAEEVKNQCDWLSKQLRKRKFVH